MGLALTMVGATVTHVRLAATDRPAPLRLLALTLLVAIEHFRPHSV